MLFLTMALVCFEAYAADRIDALEAENWAHRKGSEILDVISQPNSREKYQILDEIIQTDVDLPYIAKFVVGKYWKTMTEEQKEQYLLMFNRYILGIYKTFPLEFKSSAIDYHIEKVEVHKNAADISMPIKIEGITTSSQSENDTINIVFRVHKTDNTIKLIDIKIAGSSMLMSYRTKFYELILQDEEEIEWFLEDFEIWIPGGEESDEE